MKFAEFYSGQGLTLGPVSVSEQEIRVFAREFEPQRFHADRDALDLEATSLFELPIQCA